MRFIHIADVHLGACPNIGRAYTKNRAEELWDTFEKVIMICEKEKIDLLLIAGDLFHRQPLLRELKEVDYLFSKLTHTKVVLIAGNHDYIKPNSYYKTYKWKSNVFSLLDEELDYVEFPELETCVYGFSYGKKEISAPLYDTAFPQKRQSIEILLAHGGDENHIPIQRNKLLQLGYDYIAFGHIHRRMEIEKNRIEYAGSLEPTDKNDVGKHGYVKGEIVDGTVRTAFYPIACREYIHTDIEMNESMTKRELKDAIAEMIRNRGIESVYKITITGFCDPELKLDFEDMDVYGNVLEFIDTTRPAYDFEKLQKQNASNLLGKYIESLKGCEEGSVEYDALFEGVHALMESKRGSLC